MTSSLGVGKQFVENEGMFVASRAYLLRWGQTGKAFLICVAVLSVFHITFDPFLIALLIKESK